MLQVLDHIPEGLLGLRAKELFRVLSGPSLIHLSGVRHPALFVSTLLHGNEDSGWEALRALLLSYQDKTLPRSLSIFIGNVTAAREAKRSLAGQPDYNRIWNQIGASPEHEMMRSLLKIMAQKGVFASIDIHNNTGINPHYACITQLENHFYRLASLFSRTVVYFTRPQGVQSMAFASLCPSVTIECGRIGESAGIEHVKNFLNVCLHLSELSSESIPADALELYHTVAVLKVPPQASFSFNQSEADFIFTAQLDRLNFKKMSLNTLLGRLGREQKYHLQAFDETGEEVGDRYFDYAGGLIKTKSLLMPSMLTCDKEVIRQDCLGYLMEPMALAL